MTDCRKFKNYTVRLYKRIQKSLQVGAKTLMSVRAGVRTLHYIKMQILREEITRRVEVV